MSKQITNGNAVLVMEDALRRLLPAYFVTMEAVSFEGPLEPQNKEQNKEERTYRATVLTLSDVVQDRAATAVYFVTVSRRGRGWYFKTLRDGELRPLFHADTGFNRWCFAGADIWAQWDCLVGTAVRAIAETTPEEKLLLLRYDNVVVHVAGQLESEWFEVVWATRDSAQPNLPSDLVEVYICCDLRATRIWWVKGNRRYIHENGAWKKLKN